MSNQHITLVINSHKNNIDLALKRLLKSLDKFNINKNKIIIIIGGYENLDYEIYDESNISTIKAPHNSIDFTGLISLLELKNNFNDLEYFFYIHDTCKIGPNFFKKLYELKLCKNISYCFKGK